MLLLLTHRPIAQLAYLPSLPTSRLVFALLFFASPLLLTYSFFCGRHSCRKQSRPREDGGFGGGLPTFGLTDCQSDSAAEEFLSPYVRRWLLFLFGEKIRRSFKALLSVLAIERRTNNCSCELFLSPRPNDWLNYKRTNERKKALNKKLAPFFLLLPSLLFVSNFPAS